MNSEELAAIMTDPVRGLIHVNGFSFCRHGSEFCNRCYQDQRSLNDRAFTLDLPKIEYLHGRALQDYRKGLSVAGRILPRGQHDDAGDIIWHCSSHKRIDCGDCFDWDKLMRAEKKKKDQGKVEDRGQLLGLLQAMGAVFPPSTNLSEEALEKKLASAINLAQDMSSYSDKAPFDPSSLPVWKNTQSKSIYEAIMRGSVAEAMQSAEAQANGITNPFPLYKNAFRDLRKTVTFIANYFEKGRDSLMLQDDDQQESIFIRILEVHALNPKTPIISLLYQNMSYREPRTDDVKKAIATGSVDQIKSTVQEQALLRRLLYLNTNKLSEYYNPPVRFYEHTFKKSFLLPIGPLNQMQMGKLTNDPGCAVCSRSTEKRCSSCGSVRYCSKECQKAHWKEHKSICRSVRDGKWVETSFASNLQGMQGMSVSLINMHGSLSAQSNNDEWPDGPPANVHGEKLFLVKLQRPPSFEVAQSGMVGMLMYDRGRTVKGYIMMDSDNGEFWRETIARMPYNSSIGKIYRWARRIDAWRVSVCVDREPRSDSIQW